MNESSRYFIDCVRDLRSYAHAMMGTTRQGDAYVVACLQIVRAEPTRLAEDGDDVRLSLFKLFHKVHDMVEAGCARPGLFEDVEVIEPDEEDPSSPRVEERQVAFLISQLGFTIREAAEILDIPEPFVRNALSSAQDRLHERYLHSVAARAYSRSNPQPRRRPGTRDEEARVIDMVPGQDTRWSRRRARSAAPRERTTRPVPADQVRVLPPQPAPLPMYYRQFYDRDA